MAEISVQKEWSLFESKEREGPAEEMACAEAPLVREGLDSESRKVMYKRLNGRITYEASSAMHVIDVYGSRHPRSEEAALKLMEAYGKLMKEETLNTINCATMVHRLGSTFSALDRTSFLFDQCEGILIDLMQLLGSFHRELDARQLSNIVWGLGNMGRRLLSLSYDRISFPELYSLLLRRMTEIQNYRPQEIASCLTGMAKMQFKAETCQPALEHLTSLALLSMEDFKPHELSSLLWALGRFAYWPQNGFLKSAIQRTTETVRDFTPHQMSNVVWGFARLNVQSYLIYLLPLMENRFAVDIWDYTGQGMSLVLWSFAKLKYLPRTSTLDKAMKFVRHRLTEISPQSMSHVIYACAIFDYSPPPEVLSRLQSAFLERRDESTLQLRCLFVWSLTVLFSLERDLFRDVIWEIEEQDWKRTLREAEKRQLYQCMMHMQFFVPGEHRAMQHVSKELLLECQMAWEKGQHSKWRDAICLAVLVQLQSMGYTAFSQLLASRGLARFSVNVVRRPNRAENIAVEITIPRHRFMNDDMMIEGPRQWAMKLLRKKGFRILQVDAEVWKKLEVKKRPAYLKQLLDKLEG